MQIEIERQKEVTVLHIAGTLDAESVAQFKKTVYPMVEERKQAFVMDCTHLDFVDSMGLGAMISLLRRVRSRQGDLKICGLNKEVHSVFEITRLHHLFDICPDWKAACERF